MTVSTRVNDGARHRIVAGTVRVDDVAGLEAARSSAEITSEDGLPLAVERTMARDASAYAAHTSTAVTQAATRWYFAEGAEGLFHTFVLLENPRASATDVTVTFLREMNTQVVRTLTLGARPDARTSRATPATERTARPMTWSVRVLSKSLTASLRVNAR